MNSTDDDDDDSVLNDVLGWNAKTPPGTSETPVSTPVSRSIECRIFKNYTHDHCNCCFLDCFHMAVRRDTHDTIVAAASVTPESTPVSVSNEINRKDGTLPSREL